MGIDIPISGPGQGAQWNSTSVLVYGIMSIAGAVFAFAISASTHNSDPTDFFYDIDNQASTMFAVIGLIALILGIIFILLSFKLKNDESLKKENEARAEEEARQKYVQDIANAVKTNIKIRCRYCGTLNEESASNCISCGATL